MNDDGRSKRDREIDLLEERARRLREELLRVRGVLRARKLERDLEERIGEEVEFEALGGEPSAEAIILDRRRGRIVATDGASVRVDFGDLGEFEVRAADLRL